MIKLRSNIRRALAPIAGALALFALVVLYAAVLNGKLRAQESESDPTRELALAIAKVAANEASLATIRPAEVALIWQVTEARASTPRARLRFLEQHSSCVLGDRPLTEREIESNCVWTRNLRADDAQPDGWPATVAWSLFRGRWSQVRELASDLVTGRSDLRPCPRPPFTWGSRRIDMERALARGLVPLGCVDRNGVPTLNEGFALAGDSQ